MATIDIILSMDWEGVELREQNLKSIVNFKKTWKCPITHYLNAGYYSHPKTKNQKINEFINHAIDQYDELGLHLHTPRHLTEKAQVQVKSGPTFSRFGDYNCGDEFGQEVMLHGYSQQELERLIDYSLKVLNTNGFKGIHSFRAGGWMCDEKIIAPLKKNNIFMESSATVANLLEGSSWEGDNLQRYISILWDNIHYHSLPYFLKESQDEILEIPNNLGAIDYWKNEWIDQLIDICCENRLKDTSYVVVLNSHQETFSQHEHKLNCFLNKLSHIYDVNFVSNSNVLKRVKVAS